MTALTIHGVATDCAEQAVFLTCVEAGLGVQFSPQSIASNDPAYRRLNPFGRGPYFEFAGQTLYDPHAVAYLVMDGKRPHPLIPSDAQNYARMVQWISTCLFDLKRDISDELSSETGNSGLKQGSVIGLSQHQGQAFYAIGVVHAALAQSAFIAGEMPTLADLFLFPIINQINQDKAARAMLLSWPEIQRWMQLMHKRTSVQKLCDLLASNRSKPGQPEKIILTGA